jgi:hypothetical protein
MRLPALSFLLLGFLPCEGQPYNTRSITLEEALVLSLENNPAATNREQQRVLIRDTEKAYFYYVYLVNRGILLRDQLKLIGRIDRVASQRFESGDIDLLEKTNLTAYLADIRTTLSQLSDEIGIARNQFSLCLYSKDDYTPADSFLFMYKIRKEPIHKPDITAGRKNPDAGKEKPVRRCRKKYNEDYASFVSDVTIENLMLEMNGYFKRIQYYNEFGLGQSELIIETALKRLEKEEIDYSEFVVSISDAFVQKHIYLETLNKYNQTAIQLEYYAY